MKRKLTAASLVIVMVFSTYIVNIFNSMNNIGGRSSSYLLPFPTRVGTCGTRYDPGVICTHVPVWWGILASILFWIIIFLTVYRIMNKK
ncbi:MAG: hypothetical protein JWN37_947 [Candidatus Nomurabacteria bacterium]|nr:hypothetical protein [Candidatus Nomurabacteria bacterium]